MTRETADALLRSTLFFLMAAPATFIDLKSMRIPDLFSLGGLACLLLLDALRQPSRLALDLLAAGLAFCLFSFIRSLTKGIGFGDLKFAALSACYAGLPRWFLAMALASAAAMLCYFAALFVFKKGRNFMIPFAPFITVGALVAGVGELNAALAAPG
jgi:prepilin signal peptidase PulO-like enzyme (type II secretory pathway)